MDIVKIFEFYNYKNERVIVSYDNENEVIYYFNYHNKSSSIDNDIKNMMDNAIHYVSRSIDELLYFDNDSYDSIMESINNLIESCDSRLYINCYNDLMNLIYKYMKEECL